jgi:hypothetical protein
MVSFDVVSLFTNVPIVDSLELLSHHKEEHILVLIKHALTSTYVGVSKRSQSSSTDRQRIALRECVRCA